VGFQAVLAPGDLTVITNTADDDEFWGLHVSPDTDSVLYRLAGIFNEETGFGVAGDTFASHEMMARLGELSWFWLGDRDLAVHIARSDRLRRGRSLTEVSLELCDRLGVPSRLLPMSDQPVRTVFSTEAGRLTFQEYFVRERCVPRLLGIELEGLEGAAPTAQGVRALESADLVVIGPSNPLISVGPILALYGDGLDPARTAAVSPIVGGRALKGPTLEMMSSLGREPTPAGVAREYRGRAGWFVLDELDAALGSEIEAMGFRVEVADTVMSDGGERLARAILKIGEELK
jgi:LPPG:FO 2-phospho-L-lactate transferase